MDIDLFRDGGQFSTFDSHNFLYPCPNGLTSPDSMHNFSTTLYEWKLSPQREVNGSVSTLSTSKAFCESQPSKGSQNYEKILDAWQSLTNTDSGCEEFHIEEPLITSVENDNEMVGDAYDDLLTLPKNGSFDLPTFINGDEPKPVVQSIPVRKPRAGVKKIDLKAQKYIIDEDEGDIDVETVSESECTPVLEANDITSLLVQFEATELPDFPPEMLIKCETENTVIKTEPKEYNNCSEDSSINSKPEVVKVKQEFLENDFINIKKEVETVVNVKEEPKNEYHSKSKKRKSDERSENEVCKIKRERKHIKVEQKETEVEQAIPLTTNAERVPPPAPTRKRAPITDIPINQPPPKRFKQESCHTSERTNVSKLPQIVHKPSESTTSTTPHNPTKNNQIRDSLPEQLIARIKESSKRKTIPVIPPFPCKRRSAPRMQDVETQLNRDKPSQSDMVNSESVQLDHNYCSSKASYPEQPKKDSGFESAEEDDRAIMCKQPMVKNADGKLMVSLLKVNTIHSTPEPNKKKLNLEEYKKRRVGLLKSQGSSQTCSPMSSTCNSPMPEDEHTRLLKHQEKLRRMAKEVLNTPPKSEKKPELVSTAIPLPPQPLRIPPDMEKKTLVSIGVNTDFRIYGNIDPLAPVQQLEEIKPLLQKASAKINESSLIISLMENIPLAMRQTDTRTEGRQELNSEHGEDKTIVYLPKNRVPPKTSSVGVQTTITVIEQCKQGRYRRRSSNSSSSCSSSSSSNRQSRLSLCTRVRKESCSSASSSSSRSSHSSRSTSSYQSCSSYHSRSSHTRTSSPRLSLRERERLLEVEERRVIYVGRISSTTTKEDLRRKFQRFQKHGPITNISIHLRNHGDNYGFVTFQNKEDAHNAKEHGNDDPHFPFYDLSFGGRRIFCQTSYSDLDNMRDEATYYSPRVEEDNFDTLLRKAQEKLRKRKF